MSASESPTVPAPSPQAPPERKSGARGGLILLALVVLAAVWGFWPKPVEISTEFAEHSALQLDLHKPDALIESQHLARLPRDLLKVPVLHDLLSEDFVFYYEGNADRLGVVGTLRRIAYEHKLEWRDELVAEVLDDSAQIALWRGSDGKLAHALLRLRLGAMAQMGKALAEIAASDAQLQRVAVIRGAGEAVPVYRLRYGWERALLLASVDDQLLVFTSPGLLEADGEAAGKLGKAQVEQLDELLRGKPVFAPRFALSELRSEHRVSVSTDYLAMGYGRLVPQWGAVRAEFDGEQWSAFMAVQDLDASAVEFTPLWSAMPDSPAACVAVPVSQEALKAVLGKLSLAQSFPPSLAAQLGGPAALCWYADSRLHTPLLVTRLHAEKADDAALGEAFGQMIGTPEPSYGDQPFAVEVSQQDGQTHWLRRVTSLWGVHAAEEADNADNLEGRRYFDVGLARHGEMLLFSLDDRLVTQAIATLDRRYPPLAERLPDGVVPGLVAPQRLAALIEAEVLNSLPGDVESIFRNAAEAHLLPKLRAMGTHPTVAMRLPAEVAEDSDAQWVPVTWAQW